MSYTLEITNKRQDLSRDVNDILKTIVSQKGKQKYRKLSSFKYRIRYFFEIISKLFKFASKKFSTSFLFKAF